MITIYSNQLGTLAEAFRQSLHTEDQYVPKIARQLEPRNVEVAFKQVQGMLGFPANWARSTELCGSAAWTNS